MDSEKDINWEFWYPVVGIALGGITFLVIWIIAFANWGFLIGLAIGWLPSLVGGIIMRYIWPLPVAIVAILITFITLTDGW